MQRQKLKKYFDPTQVNGKILLLIAQGSAVLFCLFYITYVYAVNIYPDKRVKETFNETSCYILAKNISHKGHIFPRYRANFFVSYTVDDLPYSKWVSGNGLDFSFSSNKVEQENILTQYTEGSAYVCRYDPKDPMKLVLVQRHDWKATLPLMIPSIVALIAAYYFVVNLAQLLADAKVKTRELLKERKARKLSRK